MRSVSITTTPTLKPGFLLLFLASLSTIAQENSPFSRYGIGDIFPGQHVASRGMGGVSAAYIDGLGQAVNVFNPATYSTISLVTFDIGIGIDTRTLRSEIPLSNFNSVNFSPSYVTLGVPLSKKRKMGLAFGFRPISKISYSLQENKRLEGVDSMATLFEGNGGLNQVFVGVGKRWKGFSIGINAGYNFGRKETDTRIILLNDTVSYAKSNYSTQTYINKPFVSGGVQYQFKTSDRALLRFGLSANLEQQLNATQDVIRETFEYDVDGNAIPIDTVFLEKDRSGSVNMPATFIAGIAFETLTKEKFSRMQLSAEYQSTKWSKYTFFNQPDKLVDNYQVRIGGQLSPDYVKAQSFWSRITYRGGVFFGKDYINADDNELKNYGVTVGFGLPVARRNAYTTQFTNIHTAFEFGKRGSSVNNITESFFRLSVGLSLSDVWFTKRKYN